MDEYKPIKKCVGAIIVDNVDRVLLITNSKWKTDAGEDVYVVPGGEIQDNETVEEALTREIKEELGIEIDILYRVPGEKEKPSGGDFTIEKERIIIFIDFFAQARSKNIIADPREVKKILWEHTAEQLIELQQKNLLHMGNTMKGFLEKYIEWKKQN